MGSMTPEKFKKILMSRPDVHRSMVLYHLQRMGYYCMNESPNCVIEGTKYHLVCGEDAGHNGPHEDIQGGVWW